MVNARSFLFFVIIFLNLSQHSLMKFEADIIRFLQGNMNHTWITIFQIISLFGGYLGFILTFFVLFIKKKSLGYAFFVAYFVAQFSNRILKLIIARNRPFVDYSDIYNYDNEDGYSFPSGHSLGAGIFLTYLVYVILPLKISKIDKVLYTSGLSLLSLSVMLSRMCLGVHYLTDTIVGIILGISFAILSILLYNIFMRKLIFQKISSGEKDGRNFVGSDKQ